MTDVCIVTRCQQKIAELEKDQEYRSDTEETAPFDLSPTEWVGKIDLDQANTPQDYIGGFISSTPWQPKAPDSSLVLQDPDLTQKTDTNLSNGSDQESGIADLSCRSPLSEDSNRDPDSDEAANSAAWVK